jgi:single-stranded DNA-specific DHH superfamily exonuclease
MLRGAKNPLFFYDDDPDGLCSFLLLYKITTEGHGIVVKSKPFIDTSFLPRVDEYHPDLIVILDVPIVEQEFLDAVHVPVIWIDHHQPQEPVGVLYYNPRIKDLHAYIPTTRMAYQVNGNTRDMWIAMVGCLADYYLPDFTDTFVKRYPHLLKSNQTIEQARYMNDIGTISRIFSFLLKGRTSDVRKSVNVLARITSPDELLEGRTTQARYLLRKFQKIDHVYQKLLERAKNVTPEDNIILFTYRADQHSFTSELATELSHLHPDTTVVVCREKSGEMKCSLRSKTPILTALTNALRGVDGYGGGHESACGAVVKQTDWDIFLNNLKRELKENKQ